MAIGDYFHTISVLQQSGSSGQTGNRSGSWLEIATLNGVINQRYANRDNGKGKTTENSEYIGYFEYNSTNQSYLDIQYRLKDTDDKIYKIKGKAKNTMNKNHHFRVDLQFDSYISG